MRVGMFVYLTFLLINVTFLMTCVSALFKRNYVIQLTRIDDVSVMPDIVNIQELKITKYNRTSTVLIGSASILKDVPTDILCSGQAYQDLGGGKFGKGPVSVSEKECCKFLAKDEIIYPSLLKATNLPAKCPLKKMEVKITNYNVNHANLPITLPPPNDWMVEVNVTMQNPRVIGFTGRFYGTIHRDGPLAAMG